MEIPAEEVFNVLKSKGIDSIHHANTVVTACQFLRTGSLLSRGTVERQNRYQTSQQSDKIDQQYGIWFDVFADSVDIHHRAKKANAYGPVLFVIDSTLIKDAYTGKAWVTKLNPIKWAGVKDEGRWFQSGLELANGFFKGRFDQMIVIRNCDGEGTHSRPACVNCVDWSSRGWGNRRQVGDVAGSHRGVDRSSAA